MGLAIWIFAGLFFLAAFGIIANQIIGAADSQDPKFLSSSLASCTDQCFIEGTIYCSGENSFQKCENFDDDPCLELGQITGCPIGNKCNEGKCSLQETAVNCQDSDSGLEYFEKGNTNGLDNAGTQIDAEDNCIDLKTVQEFYCRRGAVSSIEFMCPYWCVEGACVTIEQ